MAEQHEFRGFLSPEADLFFYVKTHIIHALAETTSEPYGAVGHIQGNLDRYARVTPSLFEL